MVVSHFILVLLPTNYFSNYLIINYNDCQNLIDFYTVKKGVPYLIFLIIIIR